VSDDDGWIFSEKGSRPMTPSTDEMQDLRDEVAWLAEVVTAMRGACEMIVAVRHCMMFDRVHADFSVKEVLIQYDVPNVQQLAKKAQDAAEAALAMVPTTRVEGATDDHE
jgi:hypothetical protein